ncbi:MAG TPA: enoyl-CoA hydratase [Acidimicrobiales bacterium]|nr:enoyl-CoA hydratase [Acidimicrobiales bacterium]
MSDSLLAEVRDRTALLTLNRPAARNALSSELLRALPEAIVAADANDDVDVIVLTGADPAFCAGLDLRELGSSGSNLAGGATREQEWTTPWPAVSKPVIGAVNGPAVTGGFEIALNCDFLIASERAKFGDTHARVGLLPGWGLSVLLPEAVGIRRAREMSLTGNFMDAHEALQFGLVNRVVAHDDLLPVTLSIAADIAGNDQRSVRALLAEYAQITGSIYDDGLRIEARNAAEWNSRRGGFDPAEVEKRRAAIIERGRKMA